MSEQGKQVVRHYFEEIDRQRKIPLELLTPDIQVLPEGMPPMDANGFTHFGEAFFTAFPDLTHNVEQLISEGDTVVSRIVLKGTHNGNFMGIPATGRPVTFTAINIAQVAGDKLREIRVLADMGGLMQQLAPAPPAR